ncbi:hypothetical protein [Actinomadura formosensis]|uniref:hypothetical protein n=1 Tax=Actinomadura formosensis TaxID=60706 RepID=UPI003D91CCBF
MNALSLPERRLAALGAHLSARGYQIDFLGTWLKVTNADASGCCARRLSDTVTCRARPDDGNRWWYFTSWGEPIAPADQVTDAAVSIQGYLPLPER